MVIESFFRKSLAIILLFFMAYGYSQQPEEEEQNFKFKRITIGTRFLAFISNYGEKSESEIDNPYDFTDNTKLTGLNLSVNYNIINGFSVGVGSGIEKFTQPNFNYVPLYTRIALNGGVERSSFHTELQIGGHFTNSSKRGGFHRFLLGYRFRVYKTVFSDVSIIYTYQNLEQSFDNSQRLYDTYNFENVGLSVGIDIN
ncbi:hypothetical protein ACU8V7_12075 [Zobellia nedashkovskayae]